MTFFSKKEETNLSPDQWPKEEQDRLLAEAEKLKVLRAKEKEQAEASKKPIEAEKPQPQAAPYIPHEPIAPPIVPPAPPVNKPQSHGGNIEYELIKEDLKHLRGDIDSLRKELNIATSDQNTNIEIVNKNTTSVIERLDNNVRLEDVVRKQNDQIQKFHNNFHFKLRAPLLTKFIHLADFTRICLSKAEELEGEEKIKHLTSSLESFTKNIDSILRDNLVESYSDFNSKNTKLNWERQAPEENIATEDPNLDEQVAKSILPGYMWTIPEIASAAEEDKAFRFVIREEKVAIYQYENKTNKE